MEGPGEVVVNKELQEKARVAAQQLSELGYAVIAGICTAAQGEEIAASLRKTLVAVGGSKWKTTLPRSKGMLLEPNALAHCDAAWRARLACLPAFAALFGTGDLLCSFDRFNVMVRGDEVPLWLHTDQSGKLEGQQCIQGYLDINGTGPDDAGLVVCERSHLAHREMLTEWGALRDSHWYLLKKPESATARARFVTKKVQCAPGSLVLWDSRTLHENTAHTPRTTGRDRLVFYVCMLPRSVAHAAGERRYAELLEAKRAAFTGRMATTHWPVLCNKFQDAHKNEYRLTDQDIRQPAPEGAIASLAGFTEQPALEYDGEAHVSVLNPEKIFYYSV